ncbi:hypothetical protein TanjilG_19313 [Lupinus angustifolius]|uniref:Transposase Helix-turn-helix domain-containing protein n=1 Tax=Lupinus angustifolius TaxID=3871 RepID=A0A1J7G1I3_LUPAN|nr:hypothetical protein TanjilG_19313 [Lupinus angustifolius]
MTSSTFEWLSRLLELLLDCRDPENLFPLNLSARTRLGIGLFRLNNGSDYPELSTRFGVPVSAAKFCVKQLCRVLYYQVLQERYKDESCRFENDFVRGNALVTRSTLATMAKKNS